MVRTLAKSYNYNNTIITSWGWAVPSSGQGFNLFGEVDGWVGSSGNKTIKGGDAKGESRDGRSVILRYLNNPNFEFL